MKTYWLLAVITLALLAVLGLSQCVDHAKRDYEKRHPQVRSAAVAKDDNHEPVTDPNQPYQPPGWAKYVTFPEGVGAWAVILTLLAIVWQAIETRKAAEASAISARAAKSSAELSVGTSMPHLVVHDWEAGYPGQITLDGFFRHPRVNIVIKNYGETPAILKHWTLCFTCEELPDEPVYKGSSAGIVLNKVVIPPDMEYTLPPVDFFRVTEFSEEDATAIIRREKLLKAYGYICYGDIFGSRLKRFKFCQTVLNIYGGQAVCDWHEGVEGQPRYYGTDFLPMRQEQVNSGVGRKIWAWLKELEKESRYED